MNSADQSKSFKNYKPPMAYRRFGKTDEYLSAITLGGMRFKHTFLKPREEIPIEMIKQCADNVTRAFNAGINHIETAHGYGKSEHCYGKALNEVLKIPRESYYLMTKGLPATADETMALVEKQLKGLKTDYFDFYAWHGINDEESRDTSLKKGGPVEALHKLKEQGVIRHIGFSTHAPISIILEALESDYFEFVNLHYYYFFQRNYGAVRLAEEKDIGVFIISPNDKGGQLFNAPESLRKITAPFTPIQWNARFCLSHQAVHTLSFGMTEKSHYEEMLGAFPLDFPINSNDRRIKLALDAERLKDPYSDYDGYELMPDSSGINIPEILRFRRIWKCYGMNTYVRYRYNMMGQIGWFPGEYPSKKRLDQINLTQVPEHIPLRKMIEEMHETFYEPKKK